MVTREILPATFPTLRLIVDPTPRDGAIHLAIDMSLLDAMNTSSPAAKYSANQSEAIHQTRHSASPILRFYRWIPTLSLGHFQSADAIPKTFFQTKISNETDVFSNDSPPHQTLEEETLEFVKRPSGGGAILHQHEWTYALILPSGYELTFSDSPTVTSSSIESPVESVRKLHQVTAAMLRQKYHLDALLYEDVLQRNGKISLPHEEQTDEKKHVTNPSSFLCFERRAPEDVVVPNIVVPASKNKCDPAKRPERDYKILGSAMRLRRGAKLLHGSFLLRHSPWTPQLLGVADLIAERVPDAEREAWEMRFLEAWQTSILTTFFAHWTLDRTPLSDAEWLAAQTLAQRFTLPS